ncbi:probable U3 small nucleolar RNA-associated protein 11 [Phtheirospermum japonicum]|uniref:U3 small nucleolar RNA-associated protein 11 n=1 Tax=Phtheirospermum japonicum TaxID=374723 RepID=A0A830B873_9LAMI|nr:probable U3 small nucleolar RNA-associated protein 11 [Phtheirospermum japonicum]
MSSLRNAVPRKAHKERAQPHSRRRFGLLEKHKDYVERARAYHQKEQTIQKLKEKAAFRNPDEFYFKMIKTKTVNGVHRLASEANKYTKEELMLMKTQDIGYIQQKLQTEKKKIEKLSGMLHCLDNHSSSKHVYYVEDRDEAREQLAKVPGERGNPIFEDLPKDIKRKTAASYRELETRKNRVQELEKIYMDMAMQKELQKKGRKRKLREDEIVTPVSRPVYKWRQERKR